MKFGHLYRERLEEAGFPARWVDTAISYNQLKKCIKRVRQELTSLGLDAATLQRVLETAEKTSAISNKENIDSVSEDPRPLRYEFSGAAAATLIGPDPERARSIVPKLLVLVDEETGQPLDATLAPETKNYIHQLALSKKLTDIRITDDETKSISSRCSDQDPTGVDRFGDGKTSRSHRLIEVPLTNDSVFFTMLQTELLEIAALQEQEKKKLYADISDVGKALAKVTDPEDRKAKQDLAHWRSLFELYVHSQVFFATSEQNHGSQKFTEAQKRYMKFLERAQQQKLMNKFKKKESAQALQRFLAINTELLQNLRFHEFNQTAMDKILKKFDKRTALGVKSTFPNRLPPSMLSEDIAKSLSAQVATDIISLVPALDDFLCPICSELAWRPVRLRCQHIYCIRCLIRLQRDGKDHCPLCRQNVVMEADARHIDPALINFLKKYFPAEVKEKQRLNERLAVVDEFGEDYVDTSCAVM